MQRTIINWLLVFSWVGLIFYLSSQSGLVASKDGTADFLIKKSSHLGEHFILFILLLNALKKSRLHRAFILTLINAFSDEIHQIFVPLRGPKISDVAIDMSLVSFSYLILWTKKHLIK